MSLGAVIGHAWGARGEMRPLAGMLTKALHDVIRAVDRPDFTALLDTPGVDLRVFVRMRSGPKVGSYHTAGTAWTHMKRVTRLERGTAKRIALSVHLFDEAFDGPDAWLLSVIVHELRHAVDNVSWTLFLKARQEAADRAQAEDRDVDEDEPAGFREWLRRLAYMKSFAKCEHNANAAATKALMKLTDREVSALVAPFRVAHEVLSTRRRLW